MNYSDLEKKKTGVWYDSWMRKFSSIPGAMESKTIIIRDSNHYKCWVDSVADTLMDNGVYKSWLEEVSDKTNIQVNSEYVADARVGERYVLLVEHEVSKVEILKNQAIFDKVVWIINGINIDEYMIDNIEKNNLKNYYYTQDVFKYIEYYEGELIDMKKDAMVSNFAKSKIRDMELRIEHMRTNDEVYKKFLSEDWSKCSHYISSPSLNRFKYSLCPLFIDSGKNLYYRKFVFNPFNNKKDVYLKQVSYSDFFEWVKNEGSSQ